jgi:hypothetical protein
LLAVFGENIGRLAIEFDWQAAVVLDSARNPEA